VTAAPADARPPAWRRVPRPLAITALVIAAVLVAWQLFAWLAFEPLARWALPRALADRGGYQLTLGAARLHPWRLAVQLDGLALRDPQGRPLLDLPLLAADFDASASVVRRALVLESLRLERPVASIARGTDGGIDWIALLQALAGPPDPDAAPPRLLLRRLALVDGAVEWADQTVPDGYRTRIGALELALADLSTLPEDRGSHTLSASLGNGATLRWTGGFGLGPLAADGELAIDGLPLAPLWPYLRASLDIAAPGGTLDASLAYRVSEAARAPGAAPDLWLERVEARLTGLTLQGADAAEPSVALDTVSVAAGRLDLGARELVIDQLSVNGGRVAARLDADGRLNLQQWLRPPAVAAEAARTAAAATETATAPRPADRTDQTDRAGGAGGAGSAGSAESGGSAGNAGTEGSAGDTDAEAEASARDHAPATAAADAPWRVTLAKVGVEGVALQLEARGFATPWRVESDALTLGFAASARFGADAPAVEVDGLQLALQRVALTLDGAPAPWFTLASMSLDEGRVSLATRELALGRIALADGRLALSRDAQGRVSLADAVRRRAPSASSPSSGTGSTGAGAPAGGRPWRLQVAAVQASGFAVDVEDRTVSPSARLRITDLQASAESLSEDLARPLPVSLRLAVASGGTLQARGRVVPGTPSADLQVTLTGLALSPVAPYVSTFSTARLAGGRVDTRGRLRGGPETWRFDGGVAVYGLGLDEAGSGDRLLGWRRLTAPVVAVTPRWTKIGEVAVDGLAAKIVVSKERQLNLAQIVAPAQAQAAPPARAERPRYRIDVDRVRVVDGGVDFADLSLALPFGTRIHGLNGAVVGLRSSGDAAAEVELDGRVDDYGLARVTGQLRPFDPGAFTDLSVVFRNVEMPTLTPYSATFAGRKIASGRLSLDLEYKLRDRQMEGDNRIVMDRLVLGERVESPDALDLPLDLAVALLQDADGRIDLGLPVTGSLDDPQFSIGQIVWKAVVNLLTRIVTAPFRALAALFGAGEQPLDRIVFDPGAAVLLPPEQEKLDKLAGALAQRPGLAIRIEGGLDPVLDGAALRERALRRAVATLAGRPPADGEDPGPIGLSDPAVGRALETLFAQRFGAEALASLRRQAVDAAAPGAAASGPAAAASAAGGAAGAPGRLPTLLRQRLLESEPIDDAQLQALARRRAERIRQALLAQGVAPQRLALGDAVEQAGERDGVPSVLAVDAAGAAGAAGVAGPTGAPDSAPDSAPARQAPSASSVPASAPVPAPTSTAAPPPS
jgi:hypothetical protein